MVLKINHLFDFSSASSLKIADSIDVLLSKYRSQLPVFSKPVRYDIRQPISVADINIHIGQPVLCAVPWSHLNIIFKISDSWDSSDANINAWEPLLGNFDLILDEKDNLFATGATGDDIVIKLKTLMNQAVALHNSRPIIHAPPVLAPEDCPAISIITPTYNRRKLIDIAFHNLLLTDYPHDKIEWVVIEDNEDPTAMCSDKIIQFQANCKTIRVKYIPIQGRMSIGQKRNIAIEQASHDIILFMDDDDHYPQTSFRRRVAWLTNSFRRGEKSSARIVFSTSIAIYDLNTGVSAVNIPPWNLPLSQRLSEATLTFYKSAWTERRFADVSISEGESWISGRESDCCEIYPQQVIVAFSHSENASSRKVPSQNSGGQIKCFWGFPAEYLRFVHGLVGVELQMTRQTEQEQGQGQKLVKGKMIGGQRK
jgi:hypothetical protein